MEGGIVAGREDLRALGGRQDRALGVIGIGWALVLWGAFFALRGRLRP